MSSSARLDVTLSGARPRAEPRARAAPHPGRRGVRRRRARAPSGRARGATPPRSWSPDRTTPYVSRGRREARRRARRLRARRARAGRARRRRLDRRLHRLPPAARRAPRVRGRRRLRPARVDAAPGPARRRPRAHERAHLAPARSPEPPDLAVDRRLVHLAALVLPASLARSRAGGTIVALVKPQFEVGREQVGKGGVVRDAAARATPCKASPASPTGSRPRGERELRVAAAGCEEGQRGDLRPSRQRHADGARLTCGSPVDTRPPMSWFKSEEERVAEQLQELHSEYGGWRDSSRRTPTRRPIRTSASRLRSFSRPKSSNARAISERLVVLGPPPPGERPIGPIRGGRNSWERLVVMLEDYRSLLRRLSRCGYAGTTSSPKTPPWFSRCATPRPSTGRPSSTWWRAAIRTRSIEAPSAERAARGGNEGNNPDEALCFATWFR